MFICRFSLGKFLKKYNLSHSNLNRKGICRMEFLGRLENKKMGNNNSTMKSQAARTTEPHLECSLRISTILSYHHWTSNARAALILDKIRYWLRLMKTPRMNSSLSDSLNYQPQNQNSRMVQLISWAKFTCASPCC